MDASNFLWLLIVAGGPLLLALVMAFALIRRRRAGPAERQARQAATRRLYDEDEHSPRR
jgi:hypothetical protein